MQKWKQESNLEKLSYNTDSMKKIALISDNHGYVGEDVLSHLDGKDEIWHAGDIGSFEVTDALAEIKPVRAVYGNIDDHKIQKEFPLDNRFKCEQVPVWITHIGGYPNRYDKRVYAEINQNPPDLFICGHSHIVKALPDKKLDLLHLNPGAAGKVGFHQVLTLMRFELEQSQVKNLELIELEKRV